MRAPVLSPTPHIRAASESCTPVCVPPPLLVLGGLGELSWPFLCGGWQEHTKCGAGAGQTMDVNKAIATAYDSVDGGQAEPAAGELGREEGIENPR